MNIKKTKLIGVFIGMALIEIPLTILIFLNAHWSVGVMTTLLFLSMRALQIKIIRDQFV